ncbi:PREDICTED: testis anion transporter 1, partial [Nestor notabilis]|uniref:testis anion transporter 1 n=1 Tax=Nestor notabilis TaxID=176057 RepID=UPI0005238532
MDTGRQPAAHRVQREVETEAHLQAHCEREAPSALGRGLQISRKNRRLYCRFSWRRFRKIILMMFPILNWLFSYRFREWIMRDLHAGLSVGMFQIPQGSFSILNMAATNVLKTLNFNQTLSSNGSPDNYSDPSQALTLTASITFLTGIIQLLLGCCCLGLVKTYVPKTLIDACLTAAAVHVIVAQLTFIFDIVLDIPASPLDIFYIITVTIISNFIHLRAESSNAVVSMIPQRFLPPAVPDVSNLNKVILHAFSIATVSYFLLVFVGERYASLHSYRIASNQELIAVGLCNICSSFFRSFVVSCTISGTVIQERTGGRTQLAAAIGACVMLVIALNLGHFFQMIPNVIWLVTFAAVLCLGLDMGLVIAMGFTFLLITIRLHRMKMVMLGQIPNMNIYRSLSDYKAAKEIEGIKIFQCCSSISFANMNCFKTYLLNKILYSEKLVKRPSSDSQSSSSSVNLVRWSKYGDKLSSRMMLMGAADASPNFNRGVRTGRNEQDRRACRAPGSAIDNSSVHFGQEQQPLHQPCPVHTIVFDFSMVQFVDLTGSDLLRQIIHMFHSIGITVLIAGCHSSVVADFEKNDFFDSCITKERFFLTLHDAVLAALKKHQRPDELDRTAREFAEEPPAEQQK